MCGSPSELLIVLGIIGIILAINGASRLRSRPRPSQPPEDDGIRVRFLADDDGKDEDPPHDRT